MTIDLTTETPISFPALAAWVPSRRQNRPVHVATVHRWRSPGLKGIRLESIRIGGAWHTTKEAFARFCERLTAIETGEENHVAPTVDQRKKQRDADRTLAAMDW